MDVETKVPPTPTAENPLLGALFTLAGLVATHGLSAEGVNVTHGGRYVLVTLTSDPAPDPFDEVHARAVAWGHALGVSRVDVGEVLAEEGPAGGQRFVRSASVRGRIGQLDVRVHGYGLAPARTVEVAS